MPATWDPAADRLPVEAVEHFRLLIPSPAIAAIPGEQPAGQYISTVAPLANVAAPRKALRSLGAATPAAGTDKQTYVTMIFDQLISIAGDGRPAL